MFAKSPDQTLRSLLRPHVAAFAAVVLFQGIGALAGLAPLIAVVELGRIVLFPEAIAADRMWPVVAFGAVGLFVSLSATAVAAGIGHMVNRPGFDAHLPGWEGWRDVQQVRRGDQGEGGAAGPRARR